MLSRETAQGRLVAKHAQLTQLINEWRVGDDALLGDIFPAVYDELHRVARSYMHGQPEQHTLQATALINEAFLRLGNVNKEMQDRGHFIGVVANLMRQILIDHARAKNSQKRGGDVVKLSFDEHIETASNDHTSVDIMALESILKKLEKKDPRKVRIAELYFFCGATYQETAAALEISEATLQRELKMLRALLSRRMRDESDTD